MESSTNADISVTQQTNKPRFVIANQEILGIISHESFHLIRFPSFLYLSATFCARSRVEAKASDRFNEEGGFFGVISHVRREGAEGSRGG